MEKVPSIKMANEIIHLSGLPIIHSCHCFVTRISRNSTSHILFLVLLLKILITLFLLFIARQNECEEKKNLDPLCSKTSFEGKIRIFSEHFRKIQKSCGNDKIKRQGCVIAWTLIHTSSYINKHHRHFSNSMFNRSSSLSHFSHFFSDVLNFLLFHSLS